MKVRILSGNARGQVVEMGQTEAEVNIATGYAEAVSEIPTAALAGLRYVEPKASSERKHKPSEE